MKNNKTWIWLIVALIVVAVVIFFVSKNKQTVNPVTTEPPESVQDIGAQDTGIGAAPISYTNALIKYADKRIQLDTNCQAIPNNVTYKDNTGIMIDNRSPNTRAVKVGITFTIKPWGFKIVTLPDIYLKTKTLLIDCDNYQNVATILIQE